MEETAVANNIWRTVCQVILFDDITNVRFFPINDDENSNENIDYLKVLIEDAIMEAEGRDKSHQQILNHVRDSQSLVTKTPWLRHTRWEEIFVGKDMSMLGQLTNAPSIDDHRERQVWDATARVIQHCFHGVVNCQERGWTLIPFWLRSVDRNKEDTKPFRTYIAPYTLRRYISYWQQFIMFSLRAIMVEDSVQFSDRQRECLLELNSLIFEMDVDSEIEKKIFELSVLLIQHSD